MATATTGENLIQATREQYEKRLAEIEPLVIEAEQIRAHLNFMQELEHGGRRRSSASSGTGRRGRPRGSGNRQAEFVHIVNDNPGLTVQEIADRMGIEANYLYRVGPQAAEQGFVRKEDRRYFPVEDSNGGKVKKDSAAPTE